MIVKIIKETGYEEAALGFSLSYNTSIERVKEILPKFAFGVPGEGKFLESMIMYLDVKGCRTWWAEADTYRVGTTKQSESTMHTITKRRLSKEDFEDNFIFDETLIKINELIDAHKIETDKEKKKDLFVKIKRSLPEGFLQRRIWMMSYKTFQNIYWQRKTHRLPDWNIFINAVLNNMEHKEFIVQEKHE